MTISKSQFLVRNPKKQIFTNLLFSNLVAFFVASQLSRRCWQPHFHTALLCRIFEPDDTLKNSSPAHYPNDYGRVVFLYETWMEMGSRNKSRFFVSNSANVCHIFWFRFCRIRCNVAPDFRFAIPRIGTVLHGMNMNVGTHPNLLHTPNCFLFSKIAHVDYMWEVIIPKLLEIPWNR